MPALIDDQAEPNATPAPTELSSEAKVQAEPPPRRRRGFAGMDRARVSEISRMGGKAAHAAGTAHEFSSAEAVDAGRKGGSAPHVSRGRGKRAASPGA